MTIAEKTNRLGTYEAPRGLALVAIAVAAVAVAVIMVTTVHGILVVGVGDVQVYFRAGWAAWSGYPLYQVTDHHGWGYHYPPTFALLMGLFADPLPGQARLAWSLPFSVAVPVWYLINVGAIVWTMQIWAAAIARHASMALQENGISAYWALRVLPPLMLAPYIADGLTSGQPTTILVLLVAASLAAEARGRPILAAAPLAAAITIKMFPVVLLLIPILRRDYRMIFWTVVLTAVFLFAVPVALVGFDSTIHLYRDFWNERLASFVRDTIDPRVQAELSPWAHDEVSFASLIARMFATPSPDAPSLLPAWASRAEVVFDFVVLAALAAVGHRRFWKPGAAQPDAPYAILIAGATLFAGVPAMLPVAQTHYWGQATLLAGIVLVEGWRHAGRVRFLAGIAIWTALAYLAFAWTDRGMPPPLNRIGPSTIVLLALVVWGLVLLRRQRMEGGRGFRPARVSLIRPP